MSTPRQTQRQARTVARKTARKARSHAKRSTRYSMSIAAARRAAEHPDTPSLQDMGIELGSYAS